MNYLALLEQLTARDRTRAGNKAMMLGKLMREGFRVPPGFVVFANAILSPEFQKEILHAFKNLGASKVAVRSSAVDEDSSGASWAGQLATYLNTSRSKLLNNIEACRASVHAPRARAYAKNKKPGPPAVIVQTMIKSEVSGVAFSAHPVTKDKSRIIIEAGRGLGDRLVGGEYTPDSWVISKKTGKILEFQKGSQPSQKPSLLPRQVFEIAQGVARLEKILHYAVDVEWAIARGKLYHLQARPITTL